MTDEYTDPRNTSKSAAFWEFFDSEAAPKLALREKTFRRIFKHLDQVDHSLTIVETGCARIEGNWKGDGQSTVLFDRYISARDKDSIAYSVDINPVAVAQARGSVSARVQVTEADSVKFLNNLVTDLVAKGRTIDLLYLDSFDLDWDYWYPSAAHHMKELCATMRALTKQTLVVVDDCPQYGDYVSGVENQIRFVRPPSVGGKGRLVAEFAAAVGAKLEFAEYQAGWTGF